MIDLSLSQGLWLSTPLLACTLFTVVALKRQKTWANRVWLASHTFNGWFAGVLIGLVASQVYAMVAN